jgi:hypothetical protein
MSLNYPLHTFGTGTWNDEYADEITQDEDSRAFSVRKTRRDHILLPIEFSFRTLAERFFKRQLHPDLVPFVAADIKALLPNDARLAGIIDHFLAGTLAPWTVRVGFDMQSAHWGCFLEFFRAKDATTFSADSVDNALRQISSTLIPAESSVSSPEAASESPRAKVRRKA